MRLGLDLEVMGERLAPIIDFGSTAKTLDKTTAMPDALIIVLEDDYSSLAMPVFILAISLEVLWPHRGHRAAYKGKDTFESLTMLMLSVVVEVLPRLLAVGTMIYLHEISPLRDVVQRQWWAWLVLFVLDDFSYYWFHRMNHEVRLLWAGHVNHHSSKYLNFDAALRQGVGERIHKLI